MAVLAEPWHVLPSCPEEGPGWGCCQHQACLRALRPDWMGPALPTTPCSPLKWERLPSGQSPGDSFMQTGLWGHFLWKGAGVQLYRKAACAEVEPCAGVPPPCSWENGLTAAPLPHRATPGSSQSSVPAHTPKVCFSESSELFLLLV